MYSNYSIGGTTIMNKHMLSTSKKKSVNFIPFSPLHVNYFIITYHLSYHIISEKNKKKQFFFTKY